MKFLGDAIAQPAFLALAQPLDRGRSIGHRSFREVRQHEAGAGSQPVPVYTRQNVIYITPGPGGSSSPVWATSL